jgi:hypothetical protein
MPDSWTVRIGVTQATVTFHFRQSALIRRHDCSCDRNRLHRATERTKEMDMVRHHHRVVPAIALAVAFATAAPALAEPHASSPPTAPAPHGVYIRAEKTVATSGSNGPVVATSAPSTGSDVLSGHGYVNPGPAIATSAPSTGSDVLSGHGYVNPGPVVSTSAPSPGSDVLSGHGYVNPTAPATVVRTVAPSNGFDWGDAAIGAGAAIVLLLVVGAGAFGVTSGRRHAAGSAA